MISSSSFLFLPRSFLNKKNEYIPIVRFVLSYFRLFLFYNLSLIVLLHDSKNITFYKKEIEKKIPDDGDVLKKRVIKKEKKKKKKFYTTSRLNYERMQLCLRTKFFFFRFSLFLSLSNLNLKKIQISSCTVWNLTSLNKNKEIKRRLGINRARNVKNLWKRVDERFSRRKLVQVMVTCRR